MRKTDFTKVLFLTICLCFPAFLSSCNDDNSDSTPSIINGINSNLLPGHYEFSGNIRESFTLYKDGTCMYGNEEGIWQYNEQTNVLVINLTNGGASAYTIKLLTEETLTAEWSSVKYGIMTSSWKRTVL